VETPVVIRVIRAGRDGKIWLTTASTVCISTEYEFGYELTKIISLC
jgi:hypothetical protein